jgi:hypothetical protein
MKRNSTETGILIRSARSAAARSLGAVVFGGALLCAAGSTSARDLLIRNATVHTASEHGTLQGADVLVHDGRIAKVGIGLAATDGAEVIDAGGHRLTPTLFGGVTGIGLEEVSAEEPTVDATLALGAGSHRMVVRPEFDVTLAYNPASVVVPVTRIEGIGWTMLGPGTDEGGSIVAGLGGVMRLDGGLDPLGARMLFLDLGGGAKSLSGESRAAQWMLLDQFIDEAHGHIGPEANAARLTPAGRRTLLGYVDGGDGRIMVHVDRAADILQLLRWSARHRASVAVVGGAEAWKVGAALAAAKVPVFVDPLANLPDNFDSIGATMENAARLRAAGVAVGFSQAGDASHNARKIRQLAGNAVAAGMAWDDAFAGLTSVPADAFGVGADIGRVAPGRRADLVLWSGDPLEVNSVATRVWFDGRAIPMTSRQTELRDRYLHKAMPREQGGLPRAYSGAAGR